MVLGDNPCDAGETRGLTLNHLTLVLLPEQHLQAGAVRPKALPLESDCGASLDGTLELGGRGNSEDVIDGPGGIENE